MMAPPAPAPVSLRRAEQLVVEGKNESQDSQQVLEAYIASCAVGLMSSSPPPADSPLATPVPKQIASLKNTIIHQKKRSLQSKSPIGSGLPLERTPVFSGKPLNLPSLAPKTRDIRPSPDAYCGLPSPVSERRNATSAGPLPKRSRGRDAGDQLVGAANARVGDVSAPPEASGPVTRNGKMDGSQSPTQPNSERRYDGYFRASSPLQKLADEEEDRNSPTSVTKDKTLCEDDTDTVQFDFDALEGTAKTDTYLIEESSLVDTQSQGPPDAMASQHHPFGGQRPPLPETPAHPPQNPFARRQSQVLPMSQLFYAASSAVKRVSPTSSRPSPDNFQQNLISPNPPAAISSPLKARGLRSTPPYAPTSSPQILPGTTSSGPGETPSRLPGVASPRSSVISDSQDSKPQRTKSVLEPMADYEPMHKSQERRSNSAATPAVGSHGADYEDEDSVETRMKAKFRKEAALRQLDASNLLRAARITNPDIASTSKRKQAAEAEAYIAQCHGSEETESEGEDEVANLPEALLEESSAENVLPGQALAQSDAGDQEESMPDTAPGISVARRSPPLVATQPVFGHDHVSGEAIPETSPAALRKELRDDAPPPTSDLPLVSVKTETEPAPQFQSSPPAFSTRSKRAKARVSSTSSLSNLPSTPSISSSLNSVAHVSSAATDGNPSSVIADSSPAPARNKGKVAKAKLAKLRTSSRESLKAPPRSGRRLSNSTDDLSRSATATPTFEPSMRNSRLSLSKSGRTASKPPPGQWGLKIFEGMAFAISFQSKRPGETNDQYNTRQEFAVTIGKRIRQAGGRVLEAGFDELFSIPPVQTPAESPSSSAQDETEVQLTDAGRSTGFTALIADGHSRKVKYMQALALGLPCLAGRWVTTCLERGEIVDWVPYLLCAGQSTFLGDAIRSRNLVPYDAATAKLADVIDHRTKLLDGNRVLLVMKKALEGKKMAYVFLARILGASVARVYSTEEARVEVRTEDDAGTPFDWVYVDGKEDAGNLFAPPGAARGGKKRKRASTVASAAATADEPPLKKIRTLSDELVIQSLILGRLIEEGEMEE